MRYEARFALVMVVYTAAVWVPMWIFVVEGAA